MARPGTRFSSIIGNDNRYDSYNNLSVSVSKYFPLATNNMVIFISASNLLDLKNESERRYSRDYKSYKMNTYEQRTFYFGLL